MTVDVESLISTTWAKFGPTSATRPASAPPPAITISPAAMPSSEPRSMTTARRASDDSRAITDAAVVWYSSPLRSWSSAGQLLVLALQLRGGAASASSRSLSARSAAFSWRSWSISAIVETIELHVAGDAIDAPPGTA